MDIYLHPLAPVSDAQAMTVERIETTDGIKVYLRGHAHPFKGMPSEGAVNAVNILKKILMESLNLKVLLLSPKKSKKAFEEISEKVMGPFILKPEFQSPLTKELIILLKEFGLSEQTSQNLAHIFEYDSAYRFRLQDLLSETTKDKISQETTSEINRLLAINRKRDYIGVHEKFRKLATYATYLLKIPFVRRRVVKALWKVNFKNMQLDEGDRYWISLRTDYGEKNVNKIV